MVWNLTISYEGADSKGTCPNSHLVPYASSVIEADSKFHNREVV